MARGPKKHLKRLNPVVQKTWMLNKLGGIWATRPSCGPHGLSRCIPITVILRNKLKYALTAKEVLSISMRKLVKVDGKVRTDPRFPTGLMDVVSLDKSKDHMRILYDVKGRFVTVPLDEKERKFKLCKVEAVRIGPNKVPMATLHDGRTLRYVDPIIKAGDTVKLDLATGKVLETFKFDIGQLVMIINGRNRGRVGVLQSREKHPGSFEIIRIKDSSGHVFATRLSAAFVIGNENRPAIKLPRGKGVKLSIIEERDKRLKRERRK